MKKIFKGNNMDFEIRLYKCVGQTLHLQKDNGSYSKHYVPEHGQWEIWECIDGEWEHIPDEVYSYIDSEDKANQYLCAELAMSRLIDDRIKE
jgi:hypothetical protein